MMKAAFSLSWIRFALFLTLPTAAVLGAAAIATATQSGPKRAAPIPSTHAVAVQSAIRNPQSAIVNLSGPWEKSFDLAAGKTVEISVHIEKPSALPPNARIAAEWSASSLIPHPTSLPLGWRKVLHALDGDVYLLYRAPVTGKYTLRLRPVVDELPVGDTAPRWREKGHAPGIAPLPRITPWPAGMAAPVSVVVKEVNVGTQAEQDRLHTIIETEPNDSPDYAQPITLTAGDDVRTWEVTGGADDIEYFDNGRVGKSGEDWFRLEYKGTKPRLLTAQLSMPGQAVAARIRCYKLGPASAPVAEAKGEARSGAIVSDLPPSRIQVSEYLGRINPARTYYNENKVVQVEEGRDPNERVHQQDEQHRTNINRMLYPRETYFLRVEANTPGYQLQLRTLPPAPYTDPRMAIRQGMYLQIGQVDAWLTNRPRGASVERRIRDSGNMLGTACMSCHTQSGVWGPAGPIAAGYRVENLQNFWHLQNVMYECLRPTNELKDAANNTSLAPLDIGDGPAGTRAAGFNIVNLERIVAPKMLHSKMQVRTANFVLQTADPGGINAAGPGSNYGFVVVNTFASEILKTAWLKNGDPKYFRALQKKAMAVMNVDPKVTDDIGLRLDYFGRVVPMKEYVVWAGKSQTAEAAKGQKAGDGADEAMKFAEKVAAQRKMDEARLRAIQNDDGTWSFNQGKTTDGGKTWTRGDEPGDPSPTALGIWGLTSIGCGKNDPAVAKAVQALLRMQEPTGRWNRAAITGFVTCAYSMQALSRVYLEASTSPGPPLVRGGRGGAPESLVTQVDRTRRFALAAEPKYASQLIVAAKHEIPLVRYWAMIGLGATHTAEGAPAIQAALSDRTKMVRDAAAWALHQTLLDDHGWAAALAAAQTGDDYTRQGVWQALNMRADAVMSKARLNWTKLNALFDYGMNGDPNPACRAWAAKAAWQWWVWNPPVRAAVNRAWVAMLERPESNALVEHNNRYATQALFIVNGHKANGSKEHQYKELAALFQTLDKEFDQLDKSSPATRDRLARRLVGVGGTFYQTSGGDGGPGQMGYVTPNASDVMGRAALLYLKDVTKATDRIAIQTGLEGAANIPNRELTEFLVSYSLKGPEDLRQLAASAISDARVVTLAAVPEQVEPQFAQIRRGAMDPPRRPQISEPIIELWTKVNWAIPKTEEQQLSFFNIVIPKLDSYISPEELAGMTDTAKRAELEREMSANWYLADRLGDVLATNPDLHREIVLLKYFPDRIENPLQAHYWLKSVGWLLTYKNGSLGRQVVGSLGNTTETAILAASRHGLRLASLTGSSQRPNDPTTQRPDPLLSKKDRALQLYLDMLRPSASAKTRAVAIKMAGQTAFRTNPEVLRALAEWLPYEKDAALQKAIENVLNQGSEKFMPNLITVLKIEKNSSVAFDASGEPKLTKAQLDDILYFRDYVIPEMSRQKRQDQQSCMGCHGLQGRVPSLYLKAPDEYGYLPVADLVADYRTLQGKVNMSDLERSKILRKPLNVQDGKEDGHQGGRRYSPTDEGYLILKTWVEHQPELTPRPSIPVESKPLAMGIVPLMPGLLMRRRSKRSRVSGELK